MGCTAVWHLSRFRKWGRFEMSTSAEDLGDHETLFWTVMFVSLVACDHVYHLDSRDYDVSLRSWSAALVLLSWLAATLLSWFLSWWHSHSGRWLAATWCCVGELYG